MSVEFSCPHCHQLVRTPLAAAGKKGKCPQCQAVVQIPAGPALPAAPHSTPSSRPAAHATPSPPSPADDQARLEFFCVECGQLVRTPATMAGRKGKCPNCQSFIDIPRKSAGSKSSSTAMRRSDVFPNSQPTFSGNSQPPPPPLPPLPNLDPLFDDVLPTLPSIPSDALPTLSAPAWQSSLSPSSPAHAQPKRKLTDLGRRGLPWERDPSTETFFETVRYVLSAPGDAFLTMHRTGLGSPFGFFLLAAVLGNLLAVIITMVVQFILVLVYLVIADTGQPLYIKWDVLFVRLAAGCCVAIGAALISGTLGGVFSALLYHLSLLICGAANAGFATTYRVVSFGLGSVYMLACLPLVGPLFALVMQPLVLTYGFMNAHETSGPRAFLAATLPLLVGLGCFGLILLANWDAVAAAFQQALEQQRLRSGS